MKLAIGSPLWESLKSLYEVQESIAKGDRYNDMDPVPKHVTKRFDKLVSALKVRVATLKNYHKAYTLLKQTLIEGIDAAPLIEEICSKYNNVYPEYAACVEQAGESLDAMLYPVGNIEQIKSLPERLSVTGE